MDHLSIFSAAISVRCGRFVAICSGLIVVAVVVVVVVVVNVVSCFRLGQAFL